MAIGVLQSHAAALSRLLVVEVALSELCVALLSVPSTMPIQADSTYPPPLSAAREVSTYITVSKVRTNFSHLTLVRASCKLRERVE